MNANTEQWIALALGALTAVAALWGSWRMIFGWRPRKAPPSMEITERIPRYQERLPRLLVVAGTYRQFEHFCAENRLNRFHDAIYVQLPDQVRGVRNARYTLLGTYWDQPQILEILEALTYAGCVPL